jgi:uncharacterized RDD family membrane protein YckC/cytoskeletal protein CcmA (bactofilin family)
MNFRDYRNGWSRNPGFRVASPANVARTLSLTLTLTLALTLLFGGASAFAQPEAPKPPAVEAPPAPPQPPSEAAPASAPAAATPAAEADPHTDADTGPAVRRVRIDQVVAVGSSAVVRTNQTADEVVVVRGDATIEGEVDGDVVVIFGKVRITGRVDGDLVVVLGEAEVDGEVTGDLALVMSRSRFQSRADVRGDIVAVGIPPEIDPAARIRGTPEVVSLGPLVTYVEWAKEYVFQGVLLLRPFPPRLGWVWGVAGICLVLNLLVAGLFAGPMRGCMNTLREQPARSFLIGLLACILVGPLSVLLSFTVVATPLIWLAYLALCVFGRVAAYGAAGAAVGRASGSPALENPVPAVLAGSLLFYVSYMVPILGYLVYWIVLPWGIGAALIRLFDALRRERRVMIPPAAGGGGGGSGGGGGGGGGLAAAAALAAGTPGPATHATGVEPEISPVAPAGPVEPSVPPIAEPAAIPVPPVTPLPRPEPGSIPGAPPFVPLSPVEVASLPRVGFWPRFGACVIDLVVVAFVSGLLVGGARSFWVMLGIYHLAMWGWKATTLGGSILGLRLIRIDGRPVDWATAGVRVLGSVVSLLPLGIGFYWASWDDQCQSWHDRIAGTTIVKSDRRVSLV